ncbi:MAG: Na/Pi cotransporter family protein [Clostridia bacterium]|nr:Na/Pi cotransporter family protein [Clostridia bacterium]
MFASILLLLGGLGTFLIGLKMMGDNLQNIAGDRLKLLFNKVSNNKFMGIATGAGITAVIQSSSATTVMIVGFVNAGMMTLKQATSIIMGANIGTTITAQITALQSLPITPFLTAFACVGAFMAMFGKDKIAKAGMLISGIGIIFVGMRVMSTSMDDVSKSPEVINLLASVTHPLLLMLIGLVFTAVFQSSAATTSILITLCSVSLDEGGQLMTLQSAIFVTLGINIGTCVTAMLASIGANTNAKRASVIHLLFNVFGTAIFLIFIFIAPLISEKLAIHYWLAKVFPNVVSTQIAMFHTIFNILSTLILLPFTGGLTKLATILVREKKNNQEEEKDKIVAYIDERILKSPSIALMVLRKELLSMAFLAKTNFDLSIETLANLNFDKSKEFEEREKRIDYLNKKLTKFAVKISAKDISYKEEKEIASFYHVISDIERVGDYAENICESAHELVDNNLTFSDTAIEEIKMMKGAIDKLYEFVMQAFEQKSMSLKDEVNGYEDLVDTYEENLSKNHIVRLHNNDCSAESGGIFLSIISNMERVADHFRNVFTSMSTYVTPIKTKANIKEETPLADIDNNDNVRILPSANVQPNTEENKEVTAQVSTNEKEDK